MDGEIMGTGQLFLALVMLATFAEWATERLFGTWVKGQWMVLLSAAVGVVLCVLLRLDGMQLLGLSQSFIPPIVGEVITGVIVGAGSNKVHEFFKK